MRPVPNQYERYRSIFKNRHMPFAFIDLDNFDRNVEYVASTQRNTGKRIRVHSKSIRCVELIKRIINKGGPQFKGVMTFTMEETAFLAANGLDDFIVAYPTVQPSDMEIFADLTRRKKKISLMIDSIDHLRVLSQAGKKAGLTLNACLEIDTAYKPMGLPLYLGVRRSPVRTVEDALRIARISLDLPNVRINAIMGYEAHVAGPNDNLPGKRGLNRLIRFLKNRSISEFTVRRKSITERLASEGISLDIVNGGGSGSLVSTGRDPSVTEVTSGSAFYAPGLFWHYRDVDFIPSAFFGIQIVRKPAKDMVTCQGGGYVASGPAGKDKQPVPVYPEGLCLLPHEGAGEVQTPLKISEDCPELNLGDPVFFQHAKAGEICERFNFFYLVQGGNIVKKVNTYRGDGRVFL
ncbi:MAG: alanine racemase [Desulfosalsimonas sp.]